MSQRQWEPIIEAAAEIADSYTTPVTLRQLHYRLVVLAIAGYVNTLACYKRLSALTAELRRQGEFPALSDFTRDVDRVMSFDSTDDAREWLASIYRRDRTEGQRDQVWVLYEKATLGAQIQAWLEPYGIPSAALRGYSSESLERMIFEAMEADGRPVIVFYIGDLDPEGEDIERNFRAQAARQGIRFARWKRLGVTPQQITLLGLVPNFGKVGSSRAPGFIAKYGRLFQIEAEAIDPAVLQQMVLDAVLDIGNGVFDQKAYERCLRKERADRKLL